jgi:hypothetical protein
VPHLLPQMDLEPPTGYVVFVEHHLEPLREAAAGVVGTERDPDELYPAVLSAVAARWGWLELLRTRLGRAGAADSYLGQAFARQAQRWQSAQRGPDDAEPIEMRVLRPGEPLPPLEPLVAPSTAPGSPDRPAPPPVSSAAVRLAPFTRPEPRPRVAPLAEAAVAWWHAYEARRNRRMVVALTGVAVLFLLILRASQAGDAG